MELSGGEVVGAAGASGVALGCCSWIVEVGVLSAAVTGSFAVGGFSCNPHPDIPHTSNQPTRRLID